MKKVPQNGTVASHERYLYRGYLQIAALDMLDNRNVLRTLLWDPLEPVATRPLALAQGSTVTPLLNRAGGIFMRSSGTTLKISLMLWG